MIKPYHKLILILILAFALRVVVAHWREYYPLGGDEQEYLQQALIFLQEHRYAELKFMRPPLYSAFLIGAIYLFDSLIQQIRLVQAILSTLTLLPLYWLTRNLFGQRVALIAAALMALSYTLAATATELLSETLFLFGLSCSLWLLIRPLRVLQPAILSRIAHRVPYALLAGVSIGALTLVRSVALPLIPLGVLWFILSTWQAPWANQPTWGRNAIRPIALFLVGAMLVIAPWTARNYVTYGGIILIDTTGAENLWLDNDPAGREAIKRQLYAMGEDRLARQQLASRQGVAVISADLPRFLSKAAREATHFFALQYYDDLRDRPVIWVSPPDVWARLILGDALWLLVLFGGVAGLWCTPKPTNGMPDPRWIAIPWAGYTLLTACVFHVELRYRLPLWPIFVPYAAWIVAHPTLQRHARWQLIAALLTCIFLATLSLMHRPYLSDAPTLAAKHIALTRAEIALQQAEGSSNPQSTNQAARYAAEALRLDPGSVLARVLLARSALLQGNSTTAQNYLQEAELSLPAHPYPHLMLGALALKQNDPARATLEFGYESASLEDLQAWAWRVFPAILPAPSRIDLGNQLDLGHIQGFYLVEPDNTRWTTQRASLRLQAPSIPASLVLRVNGSRPQQANPAQLRISTPSGSITQALIPGWQLIEISIKPSATPILITLETTTFRPRQFDSTSPDNRDLGVQLDWVELRP